MINVKTAVKIAIVVLEFVVSGICAGALIIINMGGLSQFSSFSSDQGVLSFVLIGFVFAASLTVAEMTICSMLRGKHKLIRIFLIVHSAGAWVAVIIIALLKSKM